MLRRASRRTCCRIRSSNPLFSYLMTSICSCHKISRHDAALHRDTRNISDAYIHPSESHTSPMPMSGVHKVCDELVEPLIPGWASISANLISTGGADQERIAGARNRSDEDGSSGNLVSAIRRRDHLHISCLSKRIGEIGSSLPSEISDGFDQWQKVCWSAWLCNLNPAGKNLTK